MSHRPRKLAPASLAVCAAIILVGCQSQTQQPMASSSGTSSTGDNPSSCITDFDAEKDYFPSKTSFTTATGITVEYHKSYKIVTVKEPSKGVASESYVLVQCGAPEPQLEGDLAKAATIQIPVKKIAASSTTQVPVLQMLEASEQVVGVATPEFLYDGPIKDAVAAGKVKGYANQDGSINVEQVIALTPDLFLSGGMEDPSYTKLRESKIPVVADTSWLDTSPLGRAEWLKLSALFLNKEAKAAELFSKIETDYKAVAAKAANVETRPGVLWGQENQGSWFLPGGQSYAAVFMEDAGADYVFKDRPGTGSDPVGMEQVLAEGTKAEFWLNAQATPKWKTTAEMVAADSRYANIAAVKKGNVWNPTLRVNDAGGNDYWQQGTVRPDLVLADQVAIVHPELMPDHTFVFYQKMQ